jgi:hypothetical protein
MLKIACNLFENHHHEIDIPSDRECRAVVVGLAVGTSGQSRPDVRSNVQLADDVRREVQAWLDREHPGMPRAEYVVESAWRGAPVRLP